MNTACLLTVSALALSLAAVQPAAAAPRLGSMSMASHSISMPRMSDAPARAPNLGKPASTITVPDGKGGMKPYVSPTRPIGGSSTYNGVTTTSTLNSNGSHTVTETDETGRTTTTTPAKPASTITVPDGNGGVKPYVSPVRPIGGSSTYKGVTTTSTLNPNGTHTVTETDATGRTTVRTPAQPGPGISVDDGKGGWKPHVAPPRSRVVASSTYEGRTIVVTLNDNGTHTVTETDDEGHVTTTTH